MLETRNIELKDFWLVCEKVADKLGPILASIKLGECLYRSGVLGESNQTGLVNDFDIIKGINGIISYKVGKKIRISLTSHCRF